MTVDVHPRTWSEARAVLTDATAVVVAGGTSVQPWLNTTGAQPGALVHLGRIAGGRTVETIGNVLRLGAMTPVNHPMLTPLFGAEGAGWFATPAVRRRATVVGNAVSRLGPRELGPLLVAVGAEVGTYTADGPAEWRPVGDVLRDGLASNTVATHIALHKPDRISYHRMTPRRRLSRVEVGVCAALGLGCGVAVVVGHSGLPHPIAAANPVLGTTAGRDDFVAAVRDQIADIPLPPSTSDQVLVAATALAERVHRDLHFAGVR